MTVFAQGTELREKKLYKTNFQDWEKMSASKTATDVTKKLTTGDDLVFTLFNTAVDPTGTNAKFTEDVCTDGYLQTAKDATDVPYVLLSPVKNITTLKIVQAATGGTRGITLAVKGDGDEDWVMLHDKTIAKAGGEELTFDVNRDNCQVKIGTFAPAQNAYVLSMEIYGNVEVPVRTFTDFKVDFRSDPYTVVYPEAGLPEGVAISGGSYHGTQHGYQGHPQMVVPVDGAVKFTFGGCRYNNSGVTVKDADGNVLATVNVKDADCDNSFGDYTKFATWTYNSEKAQILTIDLGDYIPYVEANATEFVPEVTVSYYNTDGKLIGEEIVDGGSALAYKYGVEDVTIAEGKAFRGWFNGSTAKATKVAEGTVLNEDLKLYAHATDIEVVKTGAIFEYDLTTPAFYVEDHEALDIQGGKYYNNHGWILEANATITIPVAGKALVVLKDCQYGNGTDFVVTDAAGNAVATVPAKVETDGATVSFQYAGEATTLTIKNLAQSYLHAISVYNVEDFVQYNPETGYFEVPAGDGASLLLTLKSLKSGDKVFLPNGTYDFGETVLTTISASGISIIGESMDGTIIRNAPLKENEGIGTTATLLNTSDGLYMQDLTILNDMTFTGGTGRAVCLQDKGKNTICKNVKLLSYQDTYYSNAANRFYWEDCEIHGVVDYICGDGDVVYNRTKFVNEKIKNTTLAAPYTSASCKWGYVMLDCEIETLCDNFNLGRSWGGESKLQYIRCKDLSNKLVASRWTVAGMNVAAYKFKEFGMKDKDGNITTPESNIVTFTHDSGNRTYETVLSAEEAEQYTVANIYGTWAPDVTCQQVTSLDGGTIYLVDGKITTVLPTSGKVRVANSRGGFGPEIDVQATAIKNISTESASKPVKVITANGVQIVSAKKVYNALGQEL